jgi:hypothetical protein
MSFIVGGRFAIRDGDFRSIKDSQSPRLAGRASQAPETRSTDAELDLAGVGQGDV